MICFNIRSTLPCTIQLPPAVTIQPLEASTFIDIDLITSVLSNQNDENCNFDAIVDGRSDRDEVCV